MLDTPVIVMVIGFAAPMFTALFCCLIIVLYYHQGKERMHKKLSSILIFSYLAYVLCWLSMQFYILLPSVFAYIQSFAYFSMLLTQVLMYRFAFILTDINKVRKFPVIHYIIPAIITGSLFVWSFFIPFEVQLYIIDSRGETYQGYEAYTALFTSKMPMFFLYNLFYSFLALKRIYAYSKVIEDYSADEGRSSVKWLYMLFVVSLMTLPLPLISILFGKEVLTGSAITLLPVLLTMFQYIIICYNMVAGNYVIIYPPGKEETNDCTSGNTTASKIDKEHFCCYIKQVKPYLNPTLRITDMTRDLCTNRTYLSAFINQEYGVNFSRYINRCRLKELEYLRANTLDSHINHMELIQKAGFSSYRGYIRAKRAEEKI